MDFQYRRLVSIVVSVVMMFLGYHLLYLISLLCIIINDGIDLGYQNFCFIPLLILVYSWFASNLLFFVSIFKPLKTYQQGGLLRILVLGMIYGSLFGIPVSFIFKEILLRKWIFGFFISLGAFFIICSLAGLFLEKTKTPR